MFDKLDQETISSAKQAYGKLFIDQRVIKLIDYSETNRKIYLNLLYKYGKTPSDDFQYISENAIRNLMNLNNLCEEHNIMLHVLPAPMPDTETIRKTLIEQKSELDSYNIDHITQQYYSSIILYPEECFTDGVHPGGDYVTRAELNKMIVNLQEKTGELKHLIIASEDVY